MLECSICCEERAVVVTGACDHAIVCLECCFKMRSLSRDAKCPLCKQELAEVIAVEAPAVSFAELRKKPCGVFEHGILFTGEAAQRECARLVELRCPVPSCARPALPNANALRKHLREQHRRFFCELCLEHRTLLVSQQPLFRAEELRRHLEQGDFDEQQTLVFKHPFCSFCAKNFFNEEMFLEHMKKAHFRCDFCRGEQLRHVYYRAYPNLQVHFGMSHYACAQRECVEKGFVAFETREQLERHAQTHGEFRKARADGLLRGLAEPEPPQTIRDKEGVDVSGQLLSLRRSPQSEEGRPRFDDCPPEVSRLELMDLVPDERLRSLDEERALLQYHRDLANNALEYTAKNPRTTQPRFEDVKFARNEARGSGELSDFRAQLAQLLPSAEAEQLNAAVAQFEKGKGSASQLFEHFARALGPQLCYKQFYICLKALKAAHKDEECLAELQRRLDALPFRHTSPLVEVRTWKELFSRISAQLAQHIQQRVEQGLLSATKRYPLNRLLLFQLVHVVKGLTLRDVIALKFLGNFLRDFEGRTHFCRTLFCAAGEVPRHLHCLENGDLLVLFLYFSIVELLFEDRLRVLPQSGFNPNLLKLYFRHFPAFAQKRGYSLLSEPEDYEEAATQPTPGRKERRPGGNAWEAGGAAKPVQTGEKVAVFASQSAKQVFSEDYDFPSLLPAPKAKPPPVQPVQSGWGSGVTLIYRNEIQRKKALEEEFPALNITPPPAPPPSAPQPAPVIPAASGLLSALQEPTVGVAIGKVKKKRRH